MNLRNKKKVYWFIMAFIVSLLLVMGSYFIGSSKQKAKLAEQSTHYDSMYAVNVSDSTSNDLISLNPDNLVADYSRDRKNTTAAAYLSFVASEDETPVVTSLVTVAALAPGNENGVEKLAEQGLTDVKYKQMNFFGQTMNQLVKSDVAAQVEKNKPSLLLINLPTQNDYKAGTKIKDFTTDLDDLYANIRKASPETLIVFLIMPGSTEEIFEDDKYSEFVKATEAHLSDKSYNLFNLKQDFGKKAASDTIFDEKGSWTEAGLQILASEVNAALTHTSINASNGFMGENADIKESSAEESSEPESAEESVIEEPTPEHSTITETIEGEVMTEYVENPNVPEGEETVIQHGTPQVTEVTYEIVILEGEEQSRTEIESVVIVEGTPTIIERGTAAYTEPMPTPSNANSQDKQSSKVESKSDSSAQEEKENEDKDKDKDETSEEEST